MAAKRGRRSVSALFVAVLGLVAGATAQAAGQGTTAGMATFQGKGDVKEYKPGVVVWTGGFVGTSVTDARKGPLHNSGWECTGETVLRTATHFAQAASASHRSRWRHHQPAVGTDQRPRSSCRAEDQGYVSIRDREVHGNSGQLCFACRFAGALALCTITGGEYKIP